MPKNPTLLLIVLAASACGHSTQDTSTAKQTVDLGNGESIVGVPSAAFDQAADPTGSGQQHMSEWCWAATSQMILNYYGVPITQEDLVKKLFGTLQDSPATESQIIATLNGMQVETTHGTATISADSIGLTPNIIIDELDQDHPLLAGLSWTIVGEAAGGHAYVLSGVTYLHNEPNVAPTMNDIALRDPLPGNQPKLRLSWLQFQERYRTIIRIRVAFSH
jgi:ABC-type bacteriocin/lantibiotic exporter with double-glycine peptidase domain